MLLIQDLSNVRELENQLQRSERDAAVGKMAAGVAHELRNPLSSIKGLALLLKSKFNLNDESAQQTADLLVDEVERLNRSISELLDYARPAKLEHRPLIIDDLLSRALMLVRSDAEAGNVEVIEDYRCGASTIDGDEDKLTQVVLNLCLNSIQAMKDGGTLSLSSSLLDGWVTIEISDTGSGISAQNKQRIFEPYFTTKEDGTGLGLAMSAQIIEDHHGQIEISSEPGNGTTVFVKLPRKII
jgi:two-component system sensor histidine kinase HydH